MLSAHDIAAAKVAIETCNNSELKREILCSRESVDYTNGKSNKYDNKKQWDDRVGRKAAVILKNLGLPEKLQKKVMGIVHLVGMRMLIWAEYHECTLGILREYCINFINSSFFTQQGIIDDRKAAEELMNDQRLSIKQKYKLSCLYCFTDHIPALYRQMTKEDKEKFCSTRHPWNKQSVLVTFWSYHLMGKIDRIKGEITIDQYRLKKAVENGSKATVEYCLERTKLRGKYDAIIDAALEAVKHRIIAEDNLIVFRGERYAGSKKSWIPSDYYVDILYFLLSNMRDDQKVEFLKKDIKGDKYDTVFLVDFRRSRVLQYFLNWPYQNSFMNTAKLMWGFLPEKEYAVLLLKICDKIESKDGTLEYGEEKSYDYRSMLKEFWCQSPEHYKKYVLSNQEVKYRTDTIVEVKVCIGLLIKLLTLNNFTYVDENNIGLILASATNKEKGNIIFSNELRNMCIKLMEKDEWKILDRLALNCFSSEGEAYKFTREISFKKEAQRVCIDFVINDKWNAAESFIKWSSLPEAEINQLKREMIYSCYGKRECWTLFVFGESIEIVNKFCDWCFVSEKEVGKFKTVLLFSYIESLGSENVKYQLERVIEFINWCTSFEEEIIELKKNVAYKMGNFVCEEFISYSSINYIYDYYPTIRTINFKESKWEEVEKFLTWCFSSEEEISDFKKNVLLEVSGAEIHYHLIKSNQWEEAETFFAWLELTAEEIKELKKKTLFHHNEANEMLNILLACKEDDETFFDYGGEQETIELHLRWYLTDKETVLEFKDEFKRQCGDITEEVKPVLKNFDLMIEQRLKDLDNEK